VSQRDQDAPTAAEAAVVRARLAHLDQTVRCAVPGTTGGGARPGEGAAADPRFEDQGEIARGGMGSIRQVFDTRILRPVAMKLFDRARANREDQLRFLEEAQITGQLDHPNIVPVYDMEVGDDGMPMHFTMKLVRGRTLDDLIDEAPGDDEPAPSLRHRESLRLERLLRIFVKVCEAVSFAHSRGVMHRDLKPANIMVGAHGQVYVMDWGIARLREGQRPSEQEHDSEQARREQVRRDPLRQSQELPGMVLGTVAYMSPEQASGKVDEIDERTDVFGLGGVLYKILTGKAPHHAERSFMAALLRATEGRIDAPEQVAPTRSLPPGLSAITMKALAAAPADRFQSVVALQEAVEELLRGGGWFATQTFAAGQIILEEGDVGDRAYIIRRGRCEVYRRTDAANVLLSLGPGEVFGEMAILTDRPRNASVRAVDDVEVYVITRESLERELARNEWLATITRALAERFRALDRPSPYEP
jgi:serine/threonine-protein kinase